VARQETDGGGDTDHLPGIVTDIVIGNAPRGSGAADRILLQLLHRVGGGT
jgi:hypothetical protein